MKILDQLFELKDDKYGDFSSKLTPNLDRSKVIGVRIPLVRKIAKEYIKDDESKEFLKSLPHKYFDENILHGLLISEIKDYDECINYLNEFLPYVDNWAVCDTMSPTIFKKNKDKLIKNIKVWIKSKHTYTCRFGIGILMSHYLDDDFREEYLSLASSIHSEEYYVNMMIAWFFATALAKKWDETIPYIENKKLDKWVHNKTISKAIESYRISDERKEYLRSLRS